MRNSKEYMRDYMKKYIKESPTVTCAICDAKYKKYKKDRHEKTKKHMDKVKIVRLESEIETIKKNMT